MDVVASGDLMRPFNSVPDPRAHNIMHPMPSMLLIAIMAVICGAPDWQSVSQWARAKRKWLITFLDLPHGVPSHDTFTRLFARIDPDAFERCFLQWATDLMQTSGSQLIAIDGKTLRRSFDSAHRNNAIHMVSAWCQLNHLVLGQLTTEEKSNEITAIPKLLELLDLHDATVSIDAMGCQKQIAKTIIDGDGDYLLAVKGNQKTLHDDVRFFLDESIQQNFAGVKHVATENIDAGHGRLEHRRLWASGEVDWLKQQGHDWPGLGGIVCVECERLVFGEAAPSIQRRYYITSHDPHKLGADTLLAYARGHWGVENQLHWQLDVSFREDERRLRKGHGAENFSRLCRLALNLLKSEKTLKLGIANKRLNCGWDHDYLLKVLMNLA
jgi:predicted transposase YbfD/YdcC|tara:strand:- start:65 stop:1213 length:1149 start_codon:yes stop_codon:yes gene_type:complete